MQVPPTLLEEFCMSEEMCRHGIPVSCSIGIYCDLLQSVSILELEGCSAQGSCFLSEWQVLSMWPLPSAPGTGGHRLRVLRLASHCGGRVSHKPRSKQTHYSEGSKGGGVATMCSWCVWGQLSGGVTFKQYSAGVYVLGQDMSCGWLGQCVPTLLNSKLEKTLF